MLNVAEIDAKPETSQVLDWLGLRQNGGVTRHFFLTHGNFGRRVTLSTLGPPSAALIAIHVAPAPFGVSLHAKVRGMCRQRSFACRHLPTISAESAITRLSSGV